MNNDLTTLKAQAYDVLAQIQELNRQLALLNEQIGLAMQQAAAETSKPQ